MRKAKPKKRVILPDPVFNDQKVSKFVNHLMYDGKKTKSYEIFYNALETVKAKMQNEEKSALEIWKQALDNITPDRVCPQAQWQVDGRQARRRDHGCLQQPGWCLQA